MEHNQASDADLNMDEWMNIEISIALHLFEPLVDLVAAVASTSQVSQHNHDEW